MLVDLNQPASNAVQFHILRARCIEAYANLEQSLCLLLAGLLRTDIDAAGIVFFRITNAKSRNQIIEGLIKKRLGDSFQAFWFGVPNTPNKRGLMSLMSELDGKRNEIVHWHTAVDIDISNGVQDTQKLVLVKPNFWEASSQPIAEENLKTFINKTTFAQRSVVMFAMYNLPGFGPPETPDAWRDIFQRPCVYPPPSTHPLATNP